MSGICGIDPIRGSGRGATIDGSRAFQRPDHRVSYFLRRGATVDGSRGFQPTGINASYSFLRGATVDRVASCGVAPGFMRRSAARDIFGTVIRGLKPTATVMRSRRDEDGMPMHADEWAVCGRRTTIDGSRVFQRPDYRVPYFLRRGATADGSRGFQPTVTVGRYSFRRDATVDGVASLGVARGFKRRSATRYIVCDGFRGLKPTATIRRSLRDEERMPMAVVEWAMRIEKNLEGLGVW